MVSNDQKTQINKEEIIHDLNNLNYLLRAMAKMIDGAPSLSNEIKRLSVGAISATDKLIAKIGNSSKSQTISQTEKTEATSCQSVETKNV